jgi:hypothetical protein
MRPDALGDDFPDLGAKPVGFRLEGGGLRELEGQPVSLARDRRERNAECACRVVHPSDPGDVRRRYHDEGRHERSVLGEFSVELVETEAALGEPNYDQQPQHPDQEAVEHQPDGEHHERRARAVGRR